MTTASTLPPAADPGHTESASVFAPSSGETDFADAVISDPTGTGNSDVGTAPDRASVEDPCPAIRRRIANFPVPRVAAKRRSFLETSSWEGVVTQVDEEGIVAKLCRRYQDFPGEEARIPWEEIDPADREIASAGAPFSWKVGYLEIDGTRLSVSRIEFRRIPNFSAREQEAAKVKAAKYSALFHG